MGTGGYKGENEGITAVQSANTRAAELGVPRQHVRVAGSGRTLHEGDQVRDV